MIIKLLYNVLYTTHMTTCVINDLLNCADAVQTADTFSVLTFTVF